MKYSEKVFLQRALEFNVYTIQTYQEIYEEDYLNASV